MHRKDILRKLFGATAFGLVVAVCVVAGSAVAEAPAFALESPYAFGEHQHKVQLHTHTVNSDGDHEPPWVMQQYENLGYAAVAITDHDYRGRTTVSLDDPGGHGIIHIPGVEYSADENNRSWSHMLGIMIASVHHEDGLDNRQAQIDQAHAEGGMVFLCHPYSDNVHRRGWNDDDILELVAGYDGIEIYNGRSYHEPGGRDYPYKVDLVLMDGRRVNVIAVDDFHRNPEETMDRGYVVVNSDADADTVTREMLVDALKSGNYFSAGRVSPEYPTSPFFTDITVDGDTITATVDKPSDIEFITARNNYYREGTNYVQIEEAVTASSYTAVPEDQFVRIKATYREDDRISYAWSNPIYVVAAQE